MPGAEFVWVQKEENAEEPAAAGHAQNGVRSHREQVDLLMTRFQPSRFQTNSVTKVQNSYASKKGNCSKML